MVVLQTESDWLIKARAFPYFRDVTISNKHFSLNERISRKFFCEELDKVKQGKEKAERKG